MISGNMEAKLWAGALLGGMIFFALAGFVLLPAVIFALISRSERRATERLLREGARCQVLVKSYRRISMTQHRVLFEIHLPEGRAGREYVIPGLSDADLANWAVLQTPLVARVLANMEAIALEAAPPPTDSRSFFPWIAGAVLATSLVCGVMGAAMHSDDEAGLSPELSALCAALRSQQIDVANVRLLRNRPSGVAERALLDLDGEPYMAQRHSTAATAEPKADCLRKGSVELCTDSDRRTDFKRGPMRPRVRTAFASVK